MGKTWVCVGILLVLTGCNAAPSISHEPANWVDGHGGLLCDADSKRVELAFGHLLPLVNQAIRVHVLNDDEAGAWGWPSGDIYLTDGLVRILDDNELAAVIGHEMGHLLSDHHASPTVALTGRFQDDDAEIAADAKSVELLRSAGIPPQSMRLALHKMIAQNTLDSNLRLRMQARMDRLP